MKVCFAHYDGAEDIGGVSSWLQRLLPLLQMAGIEVEVHVMAFGDQPGVNCKHFNEQGICVRRMPFLSHLPYAVRSLVRLLEKAQPDIYVPSCIVPAYYAAGYARRTGIQTVGVLHSDEVYYRGIVDEFINGARDFQVSAVVPVSSFLESQVRSVAAVRGLLVRRISYGVPIPATVAKPSGSVFRLVYTGRLEEDQKQIREVTIALCALARAFPNLEAWIVGEGRARPGVEDIIRGTGMGERVHLLGWVNNAHIYDVLAQCHCLVLLSDYEGLPLSVLEGMAAGLVPICLDTRSGIREAIEHDMNGLIVKNRTTDFFNSVRQLQSDTAKWRRLSLAARQTIRQRFSVEECARQWADLFENLNKRRTGRDKFKAPRVLRLPLPDPKFDIFGMKLSRKERFKEYIKSIPPIHRMAKATVAAGQKVKSEVDRLI